jgi:hypothetical protein
MVGQCRICHIDNEELEHFSIYVTGSEGVHMCFMCKMSVTEYVRMLQSVSARAKMSGFKQGRQRKEMTLGEIRRELSDIGCIPPIKEE